MDEKLEHILALAQDARNRPLDSKVKRAYFIAVKPEVIVPILLEMDALREELRQAREDLKSIELELKACRDKLPKSWGRDW